MPKTRTFSRVKRITLSLAYFATKVLGQEGRSVINVLKRIGAIIAP